MSEAKIEAKLARITAELNLLERQVTALQVQVVNFEHLFLIHTSKITAMLADLLADGERATQIDAPGTLPMERSD
jgi:hypothetical protein